LFPRCFSHGLSQRIVFKRSVVRTVGRCVDGISALSSEPLDRDRVAKILFECFPETLI
jgi:hypothetical protein